MNGLPLIYLPNGQIHLLKADTPSLNGSIYLPDGGNYMPKAEVLPQGESPRKVRPARLRLELTESETATLIRVRDTAPRAYQRERAAAILKIAEGISVPVIAKERLLRPRAPDTVYGWFHRFKEQGIKGLLTILPGRGRKPAFSPSAPRQGSGSSGDPPRSAARPEALRHRGHSLDS